MTAKDNHMLGHTLLRATIGLLFLVMGVGKLMNPDMIIGMLTNIGFPGPGFFSWILILSEIIFGIFILIGYKVRHTAWPLAFILVVAVLTVTIPADGYSSPNAFFHYIGIAGLITIALTGPGKWAISKTH